MWGGKTCFIVNEVLSWMLRVCGEESVEECWMLRVCGEESGEERHAL